MNPRARAVALVVLLGLVSGIAPDVAAPAVASDDAQALPTDTELAEFARTALSEAYPGDAPGAAALVG